VKTNIKDEYFSISKKYQNDVDYNKTQLESCSYVIDSKAKER
jgi:hypothetical protein